MRKFLIYILFISSGLTFGGLIVLGLLLQASKKPSGVPVNPQTSSAQPANPFGSLVPIQLPAGEYWNGWLITSESLGGGGGHTPERYFFSTTTCMPRDYPLGGEHVHVLRDASGNPLLVVKD